MKFSAIVLSLLFTSAQGSMLCFNNQVASSNNVGTVLNAEVILKGTEGEPTSEEMVFIQKALIASYNNVHWEVRHFMTGKHAVDFNGPDNICADTVLMMI